MDVVEPRSNGRHHPASSLSLKDLLMLYSSYTLILILLLIIIFFYLFY
jgi:hypothetical protein